MKLINSIILVILIISLSIEVKADSITRPPNIVLIVADDVALMDFGAYGGEAATPNIDQLAANGTMFSNYHASPMCAPSRAMLMTGYDSHLTGVPNLPLFLPSDYTSKPGYKGVLNDDMETLASRLKKLNYRTYMAGKWHLGHGEQSLPSKKGFDRTFVLDASGADNFEHKAYLPTQSSPPWYEDGQAIELPEDFYSSKNFVDKIMEYIEEDAGDERPFFTFLSFQAVHIPVQAPREFIEKYNGVYDGGWHEIRKRRFQRAKEIGLISSGAVLGDMLPVLQQWDNLSDEIRKISAKSMQVNAAMLDAMDFHIGRYLQYLKEKGLYDNTIFIVTSDNGPEASDPVMVTGMGLWLRSAGYTRDIETLGEKGSYVYIGPEFASACASPSAFFKFCAGEGGLRVPFIISGKGLPSNNLESAMAYITDVTPTIMELVGGTVEEEMTGRSLMPLITDSLESVYTNDEPIGMEAAGHAALFKGDYKLTRTGLPFGDGNWKLYNLENDPGETEDLTQTKPLLYNGLMEDYERYVAENGVLTMPEGYEPLKEVTAKFIRGLKGQAMPWILALIGILASITVYRRIKIS